MAAIAQNVKSNEERAVESLPGGSFGVGSVAIILEAVAKQKLISEDLLFGIEDRLTGNKAKTWGWGDGRD
jgi:hypothetical protein